jgi:gliding motility-associated-like protein
VALLVLPALGGVGVVKAQTFTMPAGSGTQTISACSGTILDPGGTGNYQNNLNSILTINPSGPGLLVQLDFTSFELQTLTAQSGATNDFLFIYDGPNTNANILGVYSGNSANGIYNPPGIVRATQTNPTGALTLRFSTNGSMVNSGFAATISCICASGIFSASPALMCANNSSELQLTGVTPGYAIQWQQSANGTNWTNIPGANSPTYVTPPLTQSTYYRAIITCPAGAANTTNNIFVQVSASPTLVPTVTTEVCFTPLGFGQTALIDVTASFGPSPDTTYYFRNSFDNLTTDIPFVLTNGIVTQAGNNECGVKSGNAMHFTTAAARQAVTPDVDASLGGFLSFWCRIRPFPAGNGNQPCEAPDQPNEYVQLQYSIDGGNIWVPFFRLSNDGTNVSGYPGGEVWTGNNGADVLVPIPVSAQTTYTRFRWFQQANTGPDLDTWSIDDVRIFYQGPLPASSFTYSWTPSANLSNSGIKNPVFTAPNVAGTYTYTVVVTSTSTGCSNTAAVSIVVQATNNTTITPSSATYCPGGTPIALVGSTQLLPAPITYSWAPAAGLSATSGTNVAASPSQTTTYTLTATTSNGCSVTATATITVAPANIQIPGQVTNVACNGQSNGGVNISPTGGTSPYTFSWSGPSGFTASTEDISGRPPGTYSLTLTDANGCTATASFSITQPAPLTLANNQITNNQCAGQSNGSFTVVGSGGTPPLSYQIIQPFTSASQASGVFSALPAGTYIALVTDANSCTATVQAVITAPAPVAVNLTPTNPLCNGGTGTIGASATGGTGSVVFSATGLTFTGGTASGVPAGTYVVTGTDANGCTGTASVTLTAPPPLTASATPTNPVCNGGTGSITASSTGGTGTKVFTAPGLTFSGATAANVPAGTYTITVTDANNCTATTTVTLTVPPAVQVSATVTPATCSNGSATIQASGSGGTGTISFTAPGLTFNGAGLASGVAAGTYVVTATDANGCTATVSVTVQNPPNALTISGIVTDAGCAGALNGSITTTISGGTPPYTFSWNTAATTQNLTGIGVGNYTLTVTDANNCSISQAFAVGQPTSLQTSAAVVQPLCNGNANGSINLTVSGGTPNYTYAWSGANGFSASTEDLSNVIAGVYQVVVTDANSCTATQTVNLPQPPALAVTLNPTSVSCAGGSNAGITAQPAGGTPPYSYQWSGASTATTQNLTNLPAGTYVLTVTDANGCSTSAQAVIANPAGVVVQAQTVQAVACFGGNTGSITVSASGGTGVFQYSRNGTTFQASPTFANLAAGTYTITARDQNNCTETVSVTVTQPPVLTVGSAGQSNISCNGLADGGITTSVSGGTPLYTFSWTGPGGFSAATQNVSGLVSGTYVLTVTDANACTASVSITLTQPPVLIATATNVPVSCNGLSDGSINLSPAGGTAPYAFNWTGSAAFTASTEDLVGLIAGTYNVTVTDANGCTAQTSVVVNQPDVLTVALASKTDILCKGGATGAIDITISGGNTTFTYAWIRDGQPIPNTTQDLTAVAAGVYVVTVTDNKGCSATLAVTLTEPATVVSASVTGVDLLCAGVPTGSINLTVQGGTPGYTFAWAGPNNFQGISEDLAALFAGTYVATITDANGCTLTQSITLTEPPALAPTGIKTDIGCFGQVNGSIDLTVSGGVPPYTYQWSGPLFFNTQDISGLPKGTYTVVVTDNNQCSASLSLEIIEPALLTLAVDATEDVLCFGQPTGSVLLDPAGGTQPYTFVNQTTGGAPQADPLFAGLVAGTYTFVVTDASGCTAQVVAIIEQPLAPLTVNGLETEDITCNGQNDGQLFVVAFGGVLPYEVSLDGGVTFVPFGNGIFTQLSQGNYKVIVRDANGCETPQLARDIFEPTQVKLEVSVTDVSCFNQANGKAVLKGTGGKSPYTYAVLPASQPAPSDGIYANKFEYEGLAPGDYTAYVRDANGCKLSRNFTITEPTKLEITSFIPQRTDCFFSKNGKITSEVQGGTPPYTYVWNHDFSLNGPVANNLVSGNYWLVVRDAKGCLTDTARAFIVQSGEVNLPEDTTVCVNSQSALNRPIVLNSAGAQGGVWSGPGVDPIQGTFTPGAVDGPGTYTLKYSVPLDLDDDGIAEDSCSRLFKIRLNIALILEQDTVTICFGNQPVYVLPDVLHDRGFWSTRLEAAVQTGEVNINKLGLGKHPIVYTTQDGCRDTIYLHVVPLAGVDFAHASYHLYDSLVVPVIQDTILAYMPKPLVKFRNLTQDTTATYLWTFGTGDSSTLKSPEYLYKTQGVYEVKLFATTRLGCVDSVSRWVRVVDTTGVVLPNAFTPFNQDDRNDTWMVKALEMRTQEVWIYDRWGRQIAYRTAVGNILEWDGISDSGERMNEGVYTFSYRAVKLDGRVLKEAGTITLLR